MRTLALLVALLPLTANALDISLKNGNFFVGYTDVVLAGPYGFKLERVYNSKSGYVGGFGLGWGTELDTFLEKPKDGVILVHEWGGGALTGYGWDAKENAYCAERFGHQCVLATETGYEMRASDLVRVFDRYGRLTLMRKGTHSLSLEYGEHGFVTSVADAEGGRLEFAYGSDTRIASVTGSKKPARFEYDARGQLSYAEDEDGHVYRYFYDDSGRGNMVRIGYDDGTEARIDYKGPEERGNVYRIVERDGTVKEFAYEYDDPQGRLDVTSSVQKPDGDRKSEEHHFEIPKGPKPGPTREQKRADRAAKRTDQQVLERNGLHFEDPASVAARSSNAPERPALWPFIAGTAAAAAMFILLRKRVRG